MNKKSKPRVDLKIKNKLRIARAETGETQEQIANIIKVAPETYNHKESGKRDFTLTECVVLALHFDKKLDTLFMPDENTLESLKKYFLCS